MSALLPGLVRHAERFSIEGVVDAAVDLKFDEAALTRLIEELDHLEADPTYCKRHRTFPKRHKISPGERARRALGIDEAA